MCSLTPIWASQCVSKNAALLPVSLLLISTPSTYSTTESLHLLKTRGEHSDSEYPIWFCSDSKDPMERPKDESNRSHKFLEILQTAQNKGFGSIMEGQFPFYPLPFIKRRRGQETLLPFGIWILLLKLAFTLFLKNLMIITISRVNATAKILQLTKSATVPFPIKGQPCLWLLSDLDHWRLLSHLCLSGQDHGQGRILPNIPKCFPTFGIWQDPKYIWLWSPFSLQLWSPNRKCNPSASKVIFPKHIQVFSGGAFDVFVFVGLTPSFSHFASWS